MTAAVRMPLPEMAESPVLGSGLSGAPGSATQSTAPPPAPRRGQTLTIPGLGQAVAERRQSDWWSAAAQCSRDPASSPLSGRGFTVDHIRDMAGEPEDPHYWGALFAAAQRLKIVGAVGARIGRDNRLCRVWWGVPMTATLTEKRVRLRTLITQIDIDEQLRKRAAQQAILEAEAWFWCWRAEQFHDAAPKPDDFHGNATHDELLDAWQRCRDTALACRRKAAFLEWGAGAELIDPAGEVAGDYGRV